MFIFDTFWLQAFICKKPILYIYCIGHMLYSYNIIYNVGQIGCSNSNQEWFIELCRLHFSMSVTPVTFYYGESKCFIL